MVKLIFFPIWIIFCIIVCYKCKFIKKVQDFDESQFNCEKTTQIKGILALIIVLDHIAALLSTGDMIFEVFHAIGFLTVAIFFFFSGYAVEKQSIKRGDYLSREFIKNKIMSLLIPMWIVNAVYVFLEINLNIWALNIKDFKTVLLYVFDVFGLYVINSPGWYLRYLFVLFIFYFITNNLIKNKRMVNALMFALILCVTLLGAFTWKDGTGQEWGMLFCFLIGNVWASNEKKIIEYIDCNILKVFIISGVTTVLFCGLFLLHYPDIIGKLVFRNIGTCSFVVLFAIIMIFVDIGNKISYWLGLISMDIYLWHMMFIGLVNKYIDQHQIGVYIVLVLTIMMSVVGNKIRNKMTEAMKKQYI